MSQVCDEENNRTNRTMKPYQAPQKETDWHRPVQRALKENHQKQCATCTRTGTNVQGKRLMGSGFDLHRNAVSASLLATLSQASQFFLASE